MLRHVLALVAPPLCFACGESCSARAHLCAHCRRDLRWLGGEQTDASGVRVWAPLAYAGAARALVGALKYRGAIPLVDTMAAQIAATAPEGLLAGAALVPVPLHPARRRSRGFNQAERLAAALADRTRAPMADCLERTAGGRSQVGRGRSERIGAIGGAIVLRRGVRPPPRALVVDDVVTTGATMAACAAALLSAGSRHVDGLAYARTPGR